MAATQRRFGGRGSPWAVALLSAGLAAGLAACHAHGASGDAHGVTVAFTRSPTSPSSSQLSFQNGSPDPVCLAAAAFDTSNFTVKTSHGVETSAAPVPPPSDACITLAPGARLVRTVDVGQWHSRLAIQAGSFCYNYAFHGTGAAPWTAAGQVCE